MGLATVLSRAAVGIEAPQVLCEVNLSPGLPMVTIVGLPETAVRESKDRVRAAMKNSDFELPSWRTTISLAPADLPKEGARFDLPIAVGVLAASGQVPDEELHEWEFLGELSLTGRLRAVKGALPAILRVRENGRKLVLPRANAEEAGLVGDAEIYLAESLSEVAAALNGRQALARATKSTECRTWSGPDLADVLGQHRARRALEIAAAGGHNLLLMGPPGTGKTLLASRLAGILPPMEETEALEAAAIASVAGRELDPATWRQRKFRSPHHTASGVALVGGGCQLQRLTLLYKDSRYSRLTAHHLVVMGVGH
jgi:magnesium chelatase family protein